MRFSSETLKKGLRRAGRVLAAGICAALALSLVCMALAVLVQALAVLLVALLAAALFWPHPPSWYAEQCRKAARGFFDGIISVLADVAGTAEKRQGRTKEAGRAEEAEPVGRSGPAETSGDAPSDESGRTEHESGDFCGRETIFSSPSGR